MIYYYFYEQNVKHGDKKNLCWLSRGLPLILYSSHIAQFR